MILKRKMKWFALAVMVGAMPFLSTAHAESKKVGLMYHVSAEAHANYIWRGLYIGGPSLQARAMFGFGGLYLQAWGNIGATEPACQHLFPELDATLGFTRWGLDVSITHMHYFDGVGFFDFHNAAVGEPGNTTEAKIGYTISEKIPLSISWSTRFASRDGYTDEQGKLQRAWSSYIEIGYNQVLPKNWSAGIWVGMTPWKSLYTQYKGNFAVNCIDLKVRKTWLIGNHLHLYTGGRLMINPWQIDKENIRWDIYQPHTQKINADIHCGIAFEK